MLLPRIFFLGWLQPSSSVRILGGDWLKTAVTLSDRKIRTILIAHR
jgi:hypothetical protein